MSRLTVTYSEEQGGDALVYTRTREFDSRPTLEQIDDFFEEIIEAIEPDDAEDELTDDEELILQVSDIVEDVFEEQILEAVEEFVDNILDAMDETNEVGLLKAFDTVRGVRSAFDYFKLGYMMAFNKVEDIMDAELDEIREEVGHDCDGCCVECAPSRLY